MPMWSGGSGGGSEDEVGWQKFVEFPFTWTFWNCSFILSQSSSPMVWEVCRFVWYVISTKRTGRDNHACPKEVGHWWPFSQRVILSCWANLARSLHTQSLIWKRWHWKREMSEVMVKQQSLPTNLLLNKLYIYDFLGPRHRKKDTPMKSASSIGWGNLGVKTDGLESINSLLIRPG